MLSDFAWLNLGKEYSKRLLPINNHRLFQALAYEHLDKLIVENTEDDKEIGEYIALSNIGILFEPELHINIREILEQWGKTQTIILQLPASAIIDGSKISLSKYDRQYEFDIAGLNYISID